MKELHSFDDVSHTVSSTNESSLRLANQKTELKQSQNLTVIKPLSGYFYLSFNAFF